MTIRNFSQDASDVKAKVQELATSAVQQVEDAASGVSNKTQEWAGNVAAKAQEATSAVVGKTNDGIAAVGHQMNTLAGSVARRRSAQWHNQLRQRILSLPNCRREAATSKGTAWKPSAKTLPTSSAAILSHSFCSASG